MPTPPANHRPRHMLHINPVAGNARRYNDMPQIGVVIGTSTLFEPNMKDVFSTSHVEGHPLHTHRPSEDILFPIVGKKKWEGLVSQAVARIG